MTVAPPPLRLEAPARVPGKLFEVVKRAADITVSSCLLVLLLPAGLACALLVFLSSPGPVVHASRRLGKDGEPFNLYKFRSMRTGAPDWRNADGSSFTSDQDPRVTRIGRFLRKTSLDELPQLVNVLLGDMSLVGPRPDQADQIQYYSDKDKIKLSVKPGITGLAQVSGRNAIPWEARRALDVEYVRRKSLLLDLKIMFKTVPYVLKREGINMPPANQEEVS
jgi:lipopolysaccharide/colanic/teichoic acid biosynthesis glycosyltransferase